MTAVLAGLILSAASCHRAAAPIQPETIVKQIEIINETVTALDGKIAMEFVRVPEGSFMMGHIDGNPDEKPVHEVWLDTFWIGQFEVTSSQYAAFLNAVQKHATSDGHLFLDPEYEGGLIRRVSGTEYAAREGFEDFPACGITWHGAKAFADWLAEQSGLSIDLPTEAQWEKAARGLDDRQRIFPWGVRLNPSLARFKDTQPTRVGQYPAGASPFGAMDMAGNVQEWVRDWYDPDYYESSPLRNPEGPTSGTLKILRGGEWTCAYASLTKLRSSFRLPMDPQVGELTMGFRVAMNRKD